MSVETKTRFSIVFPTFNRDKLTHNCLFRTLNNTNVKRDCFEVIVVDDGSNEYSNLPDIIRGLKPDIFVQKKKNEGTIRTKNVGWSLATGDWICSIDSDFIMTPNWLSELDNYISFIPELNFVGFSDLFRMSWDDSYKKTRIANKPLYLLTDRLVSGAYAFSKKVLNTVGYLDEDFGFYGGNDTDWTTRIRKAGFKSYFIPSIWGVHVGEGGLFGTNRQRKDDALKKNGEVLNRKLKEIEEGSIYRNPFLPDDLVSVCNDRINEKFGSDDD